MKKILLMFGIVLLVAAILLFSVFYGLFSIPPVSDGITLGLDLVGGSEITYEAVVPQDINDEDLSRSMDSVRTMMRERLNNLGYTEANVYLSGSKRVIVEMPNVNNPEEAVQMLGTTAVVEFRDYTGEVIISGEDIESATASYQSSGTSGNYEYCVVLKLNETGRQKFKEGSARVAGYPSADNRYISIVMDDQLISSPTVSTEYAVGGIDTDTPIIELGNSSVDYATYLAGIISSGALPFDLNNIKLQAVGASLGERSLETAILAGIIGIILVMIYMIVFYRLPGIVADVALILYVLLFLVVMSALKINLSLPGIAGIILTIGMAVDANIVIYERIREELMLGKTLRGAVDSGFKRALSAIVDSNITTAIAGLVLLWKGTGTILGFAKTLLIGVVLSMICMLIIPRLLLRSFAGLRKYNPFMYGLPRSREKGAPTYKLLRIVSRGKIYACISGLLCITAIVSLLLLPFGVSLFNLDIDFVGGVTMEYEIGRDVTRQVSDDISDMINDAVGIKPSSVTKAGLGKSVLIKIAEIDTVQRDAIADGLAEMYGEESVVLSSSDYVSASVGKDITKAAFLASAIAALLILIYITVRFELLSGIAAVICLIHDLLVMLSMYVIFGISMNMNFIAAALTIIGYSINATIVVFDRIRENYKIGGGKEQFDKVIDRSVSQTMRRSIGTTVTTMLPIILLLILSVSSIKNFALPILIGVISGGYSSVCLAGTLWYKLKGKKDIKIR